MVVKIDDEPGENEEIDFRRLIDPLVVDQKSQPGGGGHLAVGENLEKVKTTVMEKAGEVKTTIVEKAVEVRKSIDQLFLHTTSTSSTTTPIEQQPHQQAIDDEHNTEGVESPSTNKNLGSSQEEQEHKASMGDKFESVKSAVVHKAESVRSSLVITAEELQNSFSHIFHHQDSHGKGNGKAVDGKTTERATNNEEEATSSLDANKENSTDTKIGAACSWIVHKVDDLVERVQAHDNKQPRDGETTRRLSRDLVEIISQEETEQVSKEGGTETKNEASPQTTFEEKVDQTRSVSSEHA